MNRNKILALSAAIALAFAVTTPANAQFGNALNKAKKAAKEKVVKKAKETKQKVEGSATDADGNPAQTDEDAALNITGGHMKLVQVQYAPNDWTYTFFSPKYIASYPSDGLSTTRRNLNCTGNVLVNFYGDKCIEAWLLSTNQGIAYFYAGEMPQGSALNEVAAESSMDAYFDGETLRIKGVEAAKIEVFSIYGAKIAEQTGAQQVALNVAAAGVYLVRVADTQGKVSVAKVLKK